MCGWKSTIRVKVPKEYAGKVNGLCGTIGTSFHQMYGCDGCLDATATRDKGGWRRWQSHIGPVTKWGSGFLARSFDGGPKGANSWFYRDLAEGCKPMRSTKVAGAGAGAGAGGAIALETLRLHEEGDTKCDPGTSSRYCQKVSLADH